MQGHLRAGRLTAQPQRHVLPVRPEPISPPNQELSGRRAGVRHVGPVVDHLVVVEGHDPWRGGVGSLEIGVQLVVRVALSILVEGDHVPHVVPVTVAGADPLVVAELVDVVAEKEHHVVVTAGEIPMGGEPTLPDGLAGGKGEGHAVQMLPGCRRGPRPAHWADLALGTEPVEVFAPGRQADRRQRGRSGSSRGGPASYRAVPPCGISRRWRPPTVRGRCAAPFRRTAPAAPAPGASR